MGFHSVVQRVVRGAFFYRLRAFRVPFRTPSCKLVPSIQTIPRGILTDDSPQSLYRDRLFVICFWTYVGAIAFSILGLLLLRLVPAAFELFAPYYDLLVKVPTWTYMMLMAILPMLMYAPKLEGRRFAFFLAWGSLIGAASELLGTTTGFPFGAYSYTNWLGPKIASHVPFFIPLSWFAMSILSLDLARRITARRSGRIVLAAFFMVLWDVSLDPAMGRFAQTTFWSYPGGGFYYGMPFTNWLGWFGVSLVIVAGYEWLGGGLDRSDRRAPLLYGLNCLFPILLCLVYGLYPAAAAGILAASVPYVLWYLRVRPRGTR